MQKKTILITGATSGIGLAIAKKINKHDNHQLIITGRNKEKLEDLRNSLNIPTHCMYSDIRDYDNLKSSIESIPEKFSSINVLINNAGTITKKVPTHKVNNNDFDILIDTNIKGSIYLTRLILPKMIKSNNGHVIQISSIAATNVRPNINTYASTKAFMHHFFKNLKSELRRTNIRITTIAPGVVNTNLFKNFLENKEQLNDFLNIGFLKPEDIAESIYWCINQPSNVNVSHIEIVPTGR